MKAKATILFATFLSLLQTVASLHAQTPFLLNYQGKLVIDGSPAQGARQITFTIYDASSGGSIVWSERQSVTAINGIFNVLLGNGNSVSGRPRPSLMDVFTGTGNRFLAMQVDPNPELTQRFQITSVAYAIKSTYADTALSGGGNTLDQAYDQGGPGAGRTINADAGAVNITGPDGLTVNGNVGIGAPTPGEKLHVIQGNILIDSDEEQEFRVRNTSIANNPEFRLGRISTSGDGSPECKFLYRDGITSEKNVLKFDNKGIIASVKTGLGSHFEGFIEGDAAPKFRLNSSPFMQLEFGPGGTTETDVFLRRPQTSTLSLHTAGNERMRITSSGNVGIGLQNPAGLLDVSIPDNGFVRLGKPATVSQVQFTNGRLHSEVAKFQILGQDLAGDAVPITFGQFPNDLDLTIATNGNVGIGTTTPMAKLHISGTAGVDGILFPDGTLQKTAATGGSGPGDISSVTAGTGLVGGGETGDVMLTLDTSFTDGRYVNEAQTNSINSAMIIDGAVASIDITDGAMASVDIANGAIAGVDIADDAVTSAKIQDNTITAADILTNIVSSLDGVTNDGGNIDLIAGSNITITPSDANNIITISASGPGGGLTLPFIGSDANAGTLFSITNTGTGDAGSFAIDNSSNNSAALVVGTNGNGDAGYFEITKAVNSSSAVYGATNGSGHGVTGYSSGD